MWKYIWIDLVHICICLNTKSDGGDVGGTWLQLMCCALPKCLSLIYLRGLGAEDVRGSRSWVRGVILESDGGRLSWIVVRTKGMRI